MPISLEDIFSENSPLKDIMRDFVVRPQQTAMAMAVNKGLDTGRKVVVEAGTGVGKSLAYLIPCALWAIRNKKKVLVATYTKALQEQLIQKDLPVVQQLLLAHGDNLRFSLLMGSENYLCLQRFYHAMERSSDFLEMAGRDELLAKIDEWAGSAATGLRSRIPFTLSGEVWHHINRDPDICLGKKGPCWDQCLYRKDIERARSAHILVINQHLLLSGLSEWIDYDAVVIDEAHNLEDVAVQTLGASLSTETVKRLLNDTFNVKTARGLIPRMRGIGPPLRHDIRSAVSKTHSAAKEFFDSVRDRLRLVPGFRVGDATSARRVVEPAIVPDCITGKLAAVGALLQECLPLSSAKEEEQQVQALRKRYLSIIQDVTRFLKCSEPGYVFWAELRLVRRVPTTELHICPIDVAEPLKKHLFDKKLPVVLTSATLSVDRAFSMVKERLGITDSDDTIADSPFDFKKNVRILMPGHLPDPNEASDNSAKVIADYCKGLAEIVPGGIFVLFTSWKNLHEVADELKAGLGGRQLFIQGERLPADLLHQFIAAGNGILLGTDTFWQGVDVPGSELACVVLTRLPFASPDPPLERARHEWYANRGMAPFTHYTLPKAVIKFRQGFGRLIRRHQDYGAVVILDPRVRTKNYGNTFLNSIPNCPVLENLGELKSFFHAHQSAGQHNDVPRLKIGQE